MVKRVAHLGNSLVGLLHDRCEQQPGPRKPDHSFVWFNVSADRVSEHMSDKMQDKAQ
jgi:hypothetical protein